MSTPHRATPEQWAVVEGHANSTGHYCILELRARVEALEATQQIRVFSAEEVAPIVVTTPEARPAGLVERVAEAMQPGTFDWSAYEDEARAAIREVAKWLRSEYPRREGYGTAWANLLQQEANRG